MEKNSSGTALKVKQVGYNIEIPGLKRGRRENRQKESFAL